jgi:signal transduction histidine kinase
VILPGVGVLHYGHTPLVRELRVVPILQASFLALILLAAVYAFRVRANAIASGSGRGMAGEPPTSSGHRFIAGRVDRTAARPRERPAHRARPRPHGGDLDRLGRVAHRFERIGRPPHREPVDLTRIAAQVSDYFRVRVPSLAHSVVIDTKLEDGGATIPGDPVLLEWALEALIKNAIDALAGRGGRVQVTVERTPEAARVVVADDGSMCRARAPAQGLRRGLLHQAGGWGWPRAHASHRHRVARRTIALLPTDRGATFEITFPA